VLALRSSYGSAVPVGKQLRKLLRLLSRPVPAAVLVAVVLNGLWLLLIANGGGDLAAQDAWAAFARAHPGTAYDLAWYGGMHPASYSVLSPYVMAALGVRTTLALAGIAASGLLAVLLVRSRALRRPLLPALYGAGALAGNAISGRATFGLGIMFALAAVVVAFAPARMPTHVPDAGDTGSHPLRERITNRLRGRGLVVVLAFLATTASPVAGLFLGVVAAAAWLRGQRATGVALGLPPVVVVAVTTVLFPFSGEQPMALRSVLLPVLVGTCCALLVPRGWRVARTGAAIYVLGVLAVFLVPSQVGSNITRLALVFGGVLLVAAAGESWPRPRTSPVPWINRRSARVALATGLVLATGWQVASAADDVVSADSAAVWTRAAGPLVHQLDARGAALARVEVVPTRSHREAAALAPYVNLARGWNRQADARRNTLFYTEGLLDAASYRTWLDRWAVHFVFLPRGVLDPAGRAEAALVEHGLPYLRLVWTGAGGRLYRVSDQVPLADAPAQVLRFSASEVVVSVPRPGSFRLRIPYSPWLSLIGSGGQVLPAPHRHGSARAVDVDGCFSTVVEPATADGGAEKWTVLEAPHAGTYRISTPYNLPRGTPCGEQAR
jgi:hypothetical protein